MACLATVAGCRDSSDPPPSDDPALTTPSTTIVEATTLPAPTTTAPIPLDQDPPVIDLVYAQRVLDEISRLDHEAALILYREKRVTPEYDAIITAIYFGEALDDTREATTTALSVGLAVWRDPPGPPVRSASRLLSARSDCIALIGKSDYRARFNRPVTALEGIGVILQRNIDPTPDQRRINPSSWMETVSATIAPGKNLAEACP